MSVYRWGTAGQLGSHQTSSPGNGWLTGELPMPDVRAAYNGSRVIRVDSVTARAGTGSRIFDYATGRSGWVQQGTHLILNSSTFKFRVRRSSGTIRIGFTRNSDYYTEWLDGDPVAGGVQPGEMTYFQVPSAPFTRISPSTATVGQVIVGITPPDSDGGQPVLLYTHQIATDAAFENVIAEWTSAGSTSRSGLPTRKTLFHRAMAVNAVTNFAAIKGGAASTTRSFSLGTAVVGAPSVNVASSTSGRQAVVTIVPPSNTGGLPITGYETQTQYLSPSPIPSPSTVTLAHTTITPTIKPLKPGATYRHRTRTRNVLGWGPYSAWVTEVQSRPSFNPGDYFDGSTAAEADTTYAWTGTVNKSISTATSPGVLGWSVATSYGSAPVVIARATGGLVGNYGVRVIIKQDQTSGVIRVGQANVAGIRSTVLPGSRYNGSIKVRVLRPQRMLAEIAWIDAGGTIIGYSLGPATVVPPNTEFTLSAGGDAPDLAAFAVIRSRDTAGSGYVPWRSGETYLTDGAMLSFGGPYPYFDGGFPAKGNYEYEWAGTPHNSISARKTVDVFVSPLIDPDCVVVPPAPRPPNVPNFCIEEVGIWRRIWYRVESENVAEWFDMVPILNITTGSAAERQVRIRYYANPFSRDLEDLDPSAYCAEQIISYLPPSTVLTLDGITESAWASVAGGQTIDANHLLYGSDGLPPTWAALECGIDYYIALDVPPENGDGNVNLEFDLVTRY